MAKSTASPQQRYEQFVANTIKARIPAILKGAEEGLGGDVGKQLRAIARAVEADGTMVLDLAGWPYVGWEDMPARVNGKRPSKAPFFDFEYWLYFRILRAVRYPKTQTDPFRKIKHRDLDKHLKWVDEVLPKTTTLSQALKVSLDANTHDLSQIAKPGGRYEFGLSLLEVDATRIRRLNIICDNFGGEFVGDLLLAVVAAEAGIEAVLHVKQLPIFVSDVTVDDVTILLDRIGASSNFGERLSAAVRVGMLRIATHPFWAAPQFLDKLPVEELGTGDNVLTVLKGDLNYRRAIGDVSVDIGTSFERLDVLPAAPMLSLRSIKSYCVAGIATWPAGVSRDDFPTDGSIVAVQRIPSRATAARPVTAAAPPENSVNRLRRMFRRGNAQ